MSTENNTESIIKSVSPLLTTLSDKSTRDRPVKRRAIESLKKETLQINTWTNGSTAAADLLSHLVDSLLVCTESAIESVREQTVGIMDSLIEKCKQGKIDTSTTEKILQAVMKRLKEEPTEEIRVAWMELCITLFTRLTELKISVSQSELLMEIIRIAGEDPFSEVMKRDAKLIMLYAQHQPKSTDYACDTMIRLTMPLLIHKHTAVRVLGIKAMESVLFASPKGLYLLFEFDDILGRQPIVPSLIYDSSALVRDTLFTVLGKLLCNWSPRDRYQYGDRLLPIILSGTFDELPSIQSTCQSCLDKVGISCTRDLIEADILQSMPEHAVKTGLTHLVHICFDKSLMYLLDESTDFITVKQSTALDALKLFLEYAQPDDLVKHIKKLIHHLMTVYMNNADIREKLFDVIGLLAVKLPSNDIYLDVLMSRLEPKYLATEKNGFPASKTVSTVLVFLNQFIAASDIGNATQFNRLQTTLEKPYLKEYLTEEALVYIKHINSLLNV